MKKHIVKTVVMGVFATLLFTGCGGGGGGGAPAPVTKATTKAYLFGNMSSPTSFGNLSSSGKIATIRTSIAIPTAEVMVNYSSAPLFRGLCVTRFNAIPGENCILRDGVIKPSGNILLSDSDFAGSTYNIGTNTLTVSVRNNGMIPLKSNTSGNGMEFATINLALVKAGVTSATMPVKDSVPTIGEDLPNGNSDFLLGRHINFVTTYQ